MNFALIMAAPLAVQVHLVTVFVAVLMTAVIVPTKKGTKVHKLAGRLWAVSMLITAVVSFGINSFNSPIGLSPIHLFSVVVLISVPYAIYSVRNGNIAAHKKAMTGVLVGGLGVAGGFTLMPGRLMWEFLFA